MTNSTTAFIGAPISGMGGAASGLTGGIPEAGLGGLFAALMGGADATSSTSMDGMVMVRMGGTAAVAPDALTTTVGADVPTFDVSAFLASQGAVQEEVQLEEGAPALTVTGDAQTVLDFVAKLKDVYQKLMLEGGLKLDTAGDAEELAGALTKLGLSEEEALGVAERIQTMLKLLEQNHDKIDEETAGSLVAMMLTVMAQNQAPADVATNTDEQPISVQITAASQTLTVTSFPATAWRGAGDVARDMLGLGEAVAPAKTEDSAKGAETKTFVVAVARDNTEAQIGMELPDVAKVAAKEVPTVPTAAAAPQAIAAAPVQVTKVEMSQVVKVPEGEAYYRLQADKDGVETVQALKPLTDVKDVAPETVRDMIPTTARAEAAAASAAPTVPATPSFASAERIAHVQALLDNAHVAKQVAVQIQPLAEQGGGTVRLQLNPVELGQITVELNVVEGKVHGSISASDPVVMEQLARELHTLRHGLADAGLKVSEQGIDVMLSNQNHQGQGGQGQQGQHAQAGTAGGQGRGGAVAGVEGDMAESQPLAGNLAAWVSPDRMLDVNV
ncbi:MAG: hypothetical protein DI585_06845 [Pseudomonas fluorescens]|nr:MAG: hypothetical protein DI585_06845 [Pseudomonas fluorescens]